MDDYVVTLTVNMDGDSPDAAAQYLREYVRSEKRMFVTVKDSAGTTTEVEI